ncbi:MAG: hypothetical protein ACTJHU_10205 [Mycetocola sp.]
MSSARREGDMEFIGWATLGYILTNLLLLAAVVAIIWISVAVAPRFRPLRAGRTDASSTPSARGSVHHEPSADAAADDHDGSTDR